MSLHKSNKVTQLDKTFFITLMLKAADSLLEIIGGILVLTISPKNINRVTTLLTEHELNKDPHDFISNHILKFGHDLTHAGKYFAGFYLLSHGIVKIIVIIAILKQKLWAYPAMIIVLSLFIIYQLYKISTKFSIGLTLLTIFDVFVIWLTYLEYRKHLTKFNISDSGK